MCQPSSNVCLFFFLFYFWVYVSTILQHGLAVSSGRAGTGRSVEETEKERKGEGGERREVGERREEIERVRPHPPSFPPLPCPPFTPCSPSPPPPPPLTTLAEPRQDSRSARRQGPQGMRCGCCCRRQVLQLKAPAMLVHTHIWVLPGTHMHTHMCMLA